MKTDCIGIWLSHSGVQSLIVPFARAVVLIYAARQEESPSRSERTSVNEYIGESKPGVDDDPFIESRVRIKRPAPPSVTCLRQSF